MASLAKTNPYLATPAMRRKVVRMTVATSSAIEGIHAPFRKKLAKQPDASSPEGMPDLVDLTLDGAGDHE
jgi:hypothetical protein